MNAKFHWHYISVWSIIKLERKKSHKILKSLTDFDKVRFFSLTKILGQNNPCIASTIPLIPKYKISSLQPSSVVIQPGLCGTWLETPKTCFLTTRLKGSHDAAKFFWTPEKLQKAQKL